MVASDVRTMLSGGSYTTGNDKINSPTGQTLHRACAARLQRRPAAWEQTTSIYVKAGQHRLLLTRPPGVPLSMHKRAISFSIGNRFSMRITWVLGFFGGFCERTGADKGGSLCLVYWDSLVLLHRYG